MIENWPDLWPFFGFSYLVGVFLKTLWIFPDKSKVLQHIFMIADDPRFIFHVSIAFSGISLGYSMSH